MTSKQNSSDSSANRIKAVLDGRKEIGFRELKKKADVSTQELEDFLLPLLGEGIIAGKLEVLCPSCGADLGCFAKYTDIPKENYCETCEQSNPFSDNYLEIVLEVQGDFFRGYGEPQPFTEKKYSNDELKTLLKNAIEEKDEISKGKLFEEFFRSLVERESEFILIKPHARSDTGEMDYYYRANCTGHPLWNMCPYLFIECKNRKEPVSAENMDHFVRMLGKKNRLRNNCCGVYITTKSFSRNANASAKDGFSEGLVIFRIRHSDIITLIEKGFKSYLEDDFDNILSKL